MNKEVIISINLEYNFLKGLKVLSEDIDSMNILGVIDERQTNSIQNIFESHTIQQPNLNNSTNRSNISYNNNSNNMNLSSLNVNLPYQNKNLNTFFLTKTDKFYNHTNLQEFSNVDKTPNFALKITNNQNYSTDYQKFGKIKTKISHVKNLSLFSTNIGLKPLSQPQTMNQFNTVSILLPKKFTKKNLPIKMTNITKSLNNQLARISNQYGKPEDLKKFSKENPTSQFYFDLNRYDHYKVSKISENKNIYRPKLKPLKIEKEKGIEKITNSIFAIRQALLRNKEHNVVVDS